ncbi:MAG: hypothetical protein Q7R70_04535 [Candidatus Diapherotrites archaeon]|nr:hypothetical protein [Candidatus Diapherotrites archaeon]
MPARMPFFKKKPKTPAALRNQEIKALKGKLASESSRLAKETAGKKNGLAQRLAELEAKKASAKSKMSQVRMNKSGYKIGRYFQFLKMKSLRNSFRFARRQQAISGLAGKNIESERNAREALLKAKYGKRLAGLEAQKKPRTAMPSFFGTPWGKAVNGKKPSRKAPSAGITGRSNQRNNGRLPSVLNSARAGIDGNGRVSVKKAAAKAGKNVRRIFNADLLGPLKRREDFIIAKDVLLDRIANMKKQYAGYAFRNNGASMEISEENFNILREHLQGIKDPVELAEFNSAMQEIYIDLSRIGVEEARGKQVYPLLLTFVEQLRQMK